MLFMGEEYGERQPFQFFSDHIDEKIATATREGRRREFASFAQFGEEIPDPQAAETFERSKLSWDPDPGIAALYKDLLAARREIGPGDAEAIDFDEDAKWLRLVRGGFELVCNFADAVATIPVARSDLVVGSAGARTSPGTGSSGGTITLEPLSGALLR
jgi:maltooligosyltrehalose trehalohydrolase